MIKNIMVIFAIFSTGCINHKYYSEDNLIKIIYKISVKENFLNYSQIVGYFEIVNNSDFQICIMEDVFLNDLSPYVDIQHGKKYKNDIEKIPNPPKLYSIIKMDPGEKKEFRRVIKYAKDEVNLHEEYGVSIEMAYCDDGRRFVKSVDVESDV